MTIQILFEIGEKVWFIHSKTMKATQAKLKAVKIHYDVNGSQVKYCLDIEPLPNGAEFYVHNVFSTKENLLKSL